VGSPIVVFGAFDRHNLGDLLFAHLAQALLPGEEPVFAGLASRDLRPCGGHLVGSLAEVAAELGGGPVRLLQLGGELLTCSAWQAAVMLLPPEQVQPTLAWLGPRPAMRRRWVAASLGRDDRAPYLLDRLALPNVERFVVAGVGGVDLARCTGAMRAEVLAKLRSADAVCVRDRRTLGALRTAGLDTATLAPDPAVMVKALYADRIARRGRQGPVAAVRSRFPQGYAAVQVSAAFGDDATLDGLARQLDRLHAATGCGVVLFRAGAAPWHDDRLVLERLAARLAPHRVHRFDSLQVWDLCALVARSRAVVASSLHVRIVALAFERARVSLRPPAEPAQARKLAASIEAWDAAAGAVVPVDGLADATSCALAVPAAALRHAADAAASAWRAAWDDVTRALR
jgi:hypothetical protein